MHRVIMGKVQGRDRGKVQGRVEMVEKDMWWLVQGKVMNGLLAELENPAELRLSLRRTLVRAEQDRWNKESED